MANLTQMLFYKKGWVLAEHISCLILALTLAIGSGWSQSLVKLFLAVQLLKALYGFIQDKNPKVRLLLKLYGCVIVFLLFPASNPIQLLCQMMAFYQVLLALKKAWEGLGYLYLVSACAKGCFLGSLVHLVFAFIIAGSSPRIQAYLLAFFLGLPALQDLLFSLWPSLKMPFYFQRPQILDLVLPHLLQAWIPADDPSRSEAVSDEDLIIHIGMGEGWADIVGHTSAFYQGISYNFGNHDPDQRFLLQTMGPGIMALASTESSQAFNHRLKESYFEYRIRLNPEEKEAVQFFLQEVRQPAHKRDDLTPTRFTRALLKHTDSQLYSFKEGPMVLYFLPSMNCAYLLQQILKQTSVPVVSYLELALPGTILSCLDQAYQNGHPAIVERICYKPK